MSWGRFNSFPGPSRWGTRRCPAQKPAPVVVIDVDDDGDDASVSEVYIVDGAAGAAGRGAPGFQAKKGGTSSGNVINIDDDEEAAAEGVRGDKAGPSTSRASGSPASMTPGRCGSPRNRYGMDCTSDSYETDSSLEGWTSCTDDGGSSDCEILDDTAGTAREMWETAASSRKKVPHGGPECKDGRATAFTSRTGSDTHTQPDKNSEGLFGSECHLDDNILRYFRDECKEDVLSSTVGANDGPAGCHPNGDFRWFRDACKDRAQSSAGVGKDSHDPCSVRNAKEHSNGNVSSGKETGDRKDGSPPMSVGTPEKADEKVPGGIYSQKDQSPLDVHSNNDMCSAQDDTSISGQQKEVRPSTSRCDCSGQLGENCSQIQANSCACATASIKNASVNVTSRSCTLPRKDLTGNPGELEQSVLVNDGSEYQESLICEREKHKESLEYKRAAEEEWAARQRQLQIQAEEAKKLRKRKKAEAQRLLDMEKRQKQRLQEVRESQRKNEEAIQLKERYRGVVRKELEDMETRYRDMTSILCALGIPAEGGEVKAYKQALLKFHPDRVSRNDMYQQVKAEETFKFISRLKEKLPRFS